MAVNITPRGCGPHVDSLYYNLCDLDAVWGIVLEALAAAGVIFSFVLLISLLASLPFIKNPNQRNSVALHAIFLLWTGGLFCLTFAFIVGKDFATCSSRRFLFGVLFSGCFACLLMQCVRLNIQVRTNSGPWAGFLCLGALSLFLVEVVINTEWLVITIARQPLALLNYTGGLDASAPCSIANQDFVMALIYVMTLILAVVVASLTVMAGKYSQWKKEGALILVIGLLSVAIWVAWIAMYVFGNEQTGGPTWDDPTLAIALVTNAWVFIIVYTIPQICCLSIEANEEDARENTYANPGVGFLKEDTGRNMFMENKAFSMDESNQGNKPVSPYSNYTGQLRATVYQPTEMALMTKGVSNHQRDQSFDVIIPRASTGSAANSGNSTPSNHVQASGLALNRTAHW